MKEEVFTFRSGSLEKELDTLVSRNIKQVFVNDPAITRHKNSLLSFIRNITKKAPDVLFQFEVDFEILDKDVVEALSEIYCSLDIVFPEEVWEERQLNQSLLKHISKKCNLLNDVGLVFGFVIKNATSVKAFKQLLDFIFAQYPNHIEFAFENLAPSNVLSTQDIKRLKDLAFAVSVFYTYGRAVPWFMTMVAAMKIRPSVFISDFAEWQRCNNCNFLSSFDPENTAHEEIEKMQLVFIKLKFEEKKLYHVYPIAEDLIKLHGAFSRACGEQKTTSLDLSYSPEDLFSPYCQDILLFSEQVCMEACSVEVFPSEDGADFRYL